MIQRASIGGAVLCLSIMLSGAGCSLDWTRSAPQDAALQLSDADASETPDPDPVSHPNMVAADDVSGPDPNTSDSGESVDTMLDAAPAHAPQAAAQPALGVDAGQPERDAASDAEAPDASRCQSACGLHAECDPQSQHCRCQANYYSDGSRCIPDPCAANPCGPNEVCSVTAGKAECACAPSYTDCQGTCFNLQTDRNHCGRCDLRCAGSLACTQGRCEQAVHELILGAANSCALLESDTGDYALKCWGSPEFGLFRDGSTDNVNVPRDVVGVPHARAVTLGASYRCIVPPGKDVVQCWGACADECGFDVVESESVLLEKSASDVLELASAGFLPGAAATCLLETTGYLECRGYSSFIAADTTSADFRAIDVAGQSPRFRDISGRFQHLCATLGATDQRRVACWGFSNTWGQLGAPTPATPSAVFVQLESGGDLTGVLSTSAGLAHSCAVMESGDVYCWGNNDNGLLGHNDTDLHNGAVQVVGVANAQEVTVGGSHACARVANGDLYCWGFAIGAGIETDAGADAPLYIKTPQRVPGVQDVLEVRAGDGHTCARLATGAVKCWGANDSGQVGDGSFVTHARPVAIDGLL